MKKITILLLPLFFTLVALAQTPKQKIVKIMYKSIPVSQYCIPKSQTISRPERGSDLDLLSGYKTYYDLFINLDTRSSIYTFDSLVTTKIKGREGDNVSIADEIRFVYRPAGNVTYKSESVMGQPFVTKGAVGDIEWVITNEKKQMFGFECTKAVSKNKDLMMTVWFTNAIPVSSGPAIYFGLPGLVVWAEDFFRTTQIEKIEYSADVSGFEEKLKKLETDYGKNPKKTFTKESVLIIKKTDLGLVLLKMIKAEDQK